MTDTLFFRTDPSGYEWLLFDGQGKVREEAAGDEQYFLKSLEAAGFDGKAVAVVPGKDVLLTSAFVPSKQRRQIMQAVPYVIEEQLAADIDECFFAVGGRDSQARVRVAVVSRSLMAGWVAHFAGLGLHVTAMVSENALAGQDAGTSVVVDGARAYIQWTGGGITAPVAELPLVISTLADDEPIEIHVAKGEADKFALQVSELQAAGEELLVTEEDGSPFFMLCRNYNNNHDNRNNDGNQINLLQGEFRKEEKRGAGPVVWRSVAILAGCAFLLHLVMLTGQGWYLAWKTEQYETTALNLYKEIFPADRNVRDIRRRWDARLGKAGQGDNAFLSLLARSSGGLAGAELTLDNVNFNEDRGDLIMQIVGSRSEALVQYAQGLAALGLDAEISTISQEGAGVRGSIRVRGSAP